MVYQGLFYRKNFVIMMEWYGATAQYYVFFSVYIETFTDNISKSDVMT